jgi:hypothetical protein
MDLADGELFSTRETVVWESPRCSANMRRFTCPLGIGLFNLVISQFYQFPYARGYTDFFKYIDFLLRMRPYSGCVHGLFGPGKRLPGTS